MIISSKTIGQFPAGIVDVFAPNKSRGCQLSYFTPFAVHLKCYPLISAGGFRNDHHEEYGFSRFHIHVLVLI